MAVSWNKLDSTSQGMYTYNSIGLYQSYTKQVLKGNFVATRHLLLPFL